MYWIFVLAMSFVGLVVFGAQSPGFYATSFVGFMVAGRYRSNRQRNRQAVAASLDKQEGQALPDPFPPETHRATVSTVTVPSGSRSAAVPAQAIGSGGHATVDQRNVRGGRFWWLVPIGIGIWIISDGKEPASTRQAGPPSLVSRIAGDAWRQADCLRRSFPDGMAAGMQVPPEALQFCSAPWDSKVIDGAFRVIVDQEISMSEMAPATPPQVFTIIEQGDPAIYHFWLGRVDEFDQA